MEYYLEESTDIGGLKNAVRIAKSTDRHHPHNRSYHCRLGNPVLGAVFRQPVPSDHPGPDRSRDALEGLAGKPDLDGDRRPAHDRGNTTLALELIL